jgi:hypothetical protein
MTATPMRLASKKLIVKSMVGSIGMDAPRKLTPPSRQMTLL